MLLTIAIPTFERQSDLHSLLTSVARELSNIDADDLIEVVVCDNASGDQTQEVCEGFSKIISNFKYKRNRTNLGFQRNFVECFHTASGDFVWLIGDDETIEPGGISEVVRTIGKKNIDVAIFNYSSEPEPPGVNFLKTVFGNPLLSLESELFDFVWNHGWLWTLGNLGMVVVNREKLLKVDPETYISCNFFQAAWYLEAFRNAPMCFKHNAVFRTYIKSQTVNKERWKSDGTSHRMKNVVESLKSMMRREVIPQSLSIKFLNGCSTDRMPLWNYLLSPLIDGLRRNEVDFDKDYLDRVLFLVNLLDDKDLRFKLTSNLTSIFNKLSVVQQIRQSYFDNLGSLINEFNSTYPALRFGSVD
jgi:glycosyltransferase involved in cell wall biosynthesis